MNPSKYIIQVDCGDDRMTTGKIGHEHQILDTSVVRNHRSRLHQLLDVAIDRAEAQYRKLATK